MSSYGTAPPLAIVCPIMALLRCSPVWLPILTACASAPAPECPLAGARLVDELIEADERHFAHLWKVTSGGENAEGYWSFAGDSLILQRTEAEAGIPCDRIFVTAPGGGLRQVSSGQGVTTCGYFHPDGRRVLFASTHASGAACPPPLDHSQGYTWRINPEYDLWRVDLEGGGAERLTDQWGYDAEATISPRGDRLVFTSTRSGDLELWTADLDLRNPVQLTDELGYDGGAFFSHDGRRLVFRSTRFAPGQEAEEHARYRQLLAEWKVRPHSMELMLIDADGGNRRQLTHLGGASFAPFFYPDDSRVIFSTNHHESSARNFDLFAIGVDGQDLERITTYDGFDSFPMFSPDGRYLAFSSNRGGARPGETNLFVAAWR